MNPLVMRKKAITVSLLLSFAAVAVGAETLENLKTERREIKRAIRKAVPDATKIDPALVELQRASLAANKALNEAMEAHPGLSTLNAEIKQVFDSMVKAVAANDAAAKQAAQEKNSELRARRDEQASKIPELAELIAANTAASTAYFQKEREVIASHPATKDLAARLTEINKAIQQEGKK